jgi:predicted MFS family arabinose efflux permease
MSTLAHTARLSRTFDPGLSRPVWTLQAGMLVNALGNGVVLPFLVIYLHNVRGFPLATSGLVLAVYGAAGLAGTASGGVAADRVGARMTLAAALVLSAIGYGLLPLVAKPWHAVGLLAVAGVGNGAFWPSQSAMLVGHTAEDRRHVAFAINRVVVNIGVGLGGLAGGLIAVTTTPWTFSVLFVADATTFLLFAAMLALIPPLPPRESQEGRAAGGYAAVLRDRTFVAFVGLNCLFVVVALAQLEATLPVFAKNEAGMSERAIGLMFFLNVAVIVVAQMPVVRLLAGRSRMRALAVMCLVFAVCWSAVLAGDLLPGAGAAAAVTAAVILFAVGECLFAPSQGGLLADLARPELRGRYFALSTSSYAVGFTLGPALGGLALAASPAALWSGAAALCLVAAGLCLALERRLPQSARLAPV